MNRFAFSRAKTVAEAAGAITASVADAMLAKPTADAGSIVAKAGGIDLMDLMKEGLLAPAALVSLGAIPGLADIAVLGDGGLRIGAIATLAQVAEDARVAQHWPALSDAVRLSAGPEIRNVATIGGNLLQRPRCWYFRSEAFHCLRKGGGHCFAIHGESQYHAIFDNQACAIVHPSTPATSLVALGARIELVDGSGATRTPMLEAFLTLPDQDLQRENDLHPSEILTAILLPAPTAMTKMAHLRLSEKQAFDWPLADVTVVLEIDPQGLCRTASIVLGAAAPVPHRAKAAEASLVGRRVDAAAAAAAGKAALDGATPLLKNTYKLPMFEALVGRAIAQAAAR